MFVIEETYVLSISCAILCGPLAGLELLFIKYFSCIQYVFDVYINVSNLHSPGHNHFWILDDVINNGFYNADFEETYF